MKDFKTFAQENKVRIPLIQRDYVQGSDTNAAKRDKFLEALLSALETGTPLSLDFIYGSTNSGYFEPLDGQQRITTLFLLYYALKNLSHVQPTKELDEQIRTFTYTTRNSSAAFCQKLFGTEMPWRYTKVFDEEGKKEWSQDIINQPWFCEEWLLDPTIKAMLDMLDALNKRLHAEEYMKPYYGGKAINEVDGQTVYEESSEKWDTMAENLYGNGTGCILFECLNMGEYNLDDSLYIKMNARGKQLTDFENWKAEFIKYLETKCKDDTYKGIPIRTYFEQHIEHEWADMLWTYAVERMDNDNEEYPQTDDLFMNLYEYLLGMIFFVKNPTINRRDVKTEDFYQSKAECLSNIEKEDLDFLFAALDFFIAIGNQQAFFDNLFYLQDEDSNRKVRLFNTPNTDLFELCICKDKAFTAKMQVLSYCIVRYGIQYGVDVTEELVQYTRVCRNLIESIVQREDGVTIRSNVRLADMAKYKAVIDQLIADKDVRKSLENIGDNITGFGNIAHEKEKATWQMDLHTIEDFGFIRGNLQAFDTQQLAEHYEKVCEALQEFRIDDKDKEKTLVRLLISYGFTGVGCGWCKLGKRYFFGTRSKWDTLFYADIHDNQTFPAALKTYIDGYCNGKDSNRQYEDIQIPDETTDAFNYYVLKYPTSCDLWWDYGRHYVSIAQNDHNSYGYIELNNYSFNPLLSYYSDIFSKAAYNELSKQNVDKNRVKIYPARYSDNDPKLSLDKTWKLVCRKDGWHITQEQASTAVMPADLIEKYQITEESAPNTSYMLLPRIEGKDLVETAVVFIADYLKSVTCIK